MSARLRGESLLPHHSWTTSTPGRLPSAFAGRAMYPLSVVPSAEYETSSPAAAAPTTTSMARLTRVRPRAIRLMEGSSLSRARVPAMIPPAQSRSGSRRRSGPSELARPDVPGDDTPALDDPELLGLLGDRLRGVARVEHDEVGATALRQAVVGEPDRAGGVGRDQLQEPRQLVEVAEVCGHRRHERLAEQVGVAVR